jgi:hypothetical protein
MIWARPIPIDIYLFGGAERNSLTMRPDEHRRLREECMAMARQSNSPNVQARWLALAQAWSRRCDNRNVNPSNVIRLNFNRRGAAPVFPSAAVFPTATASAKAFVIY